MLQPIVLISGKKNSGKSTFGKMMLNSFQAKVKIPFDFRETAFADPLKRMVRDLIGISGDVLWGEMEAKENTYAYGKTARHWMQWLGTEIFREQVNENIWVDATIRHIQTSLAQVPVGWIVTDCRFPNEWEVLQDRLTSESGHKCFLIGISRPNTLTQDNHRSETGVDELEKFLPFPIYNTEDLVALNRRANNLVNKILLKCEIPNGNKELL